MSSNVWIAGVGMIPFKKPGQSMSYLDMGAAAIRLALEDAGIDLDEVNQAYAGYVYGDSTSGQRALYEVGMTGMPVINVNNNCSSGSTALYLARQAIMGGAADCVLAFGFEQMQPGAITTHWNDRPNTFQRFEDMANELESANLPLALKYFGGAGREHMQRYGTPLSTFAEVRAKASRHAANNPLAVFRDVVTADDVLASKELWPGVLHKLMACPPTSGAAAALVVSDRFAKKMANTPMVRILAQQLTTDFRSTFDSGSMIDLVGSKLTEAAAKSVYEQAGVGPQDVDVCELHDCFAQNEVLSYEALGFCGEGEAARFVADGDNTYGGQVVVNPSGGLLSKGHPLGATGLAQCYELTRQLRGTAGPTQVSGAEIGMQHNLGLGGAAVVTLFGKAA
ncbi:lipid-transfer protein [Ramlibacter sp.]|uniref:lipid-transfer protein n=1 Tax=Ramlibacter sp. TaxID=1917967 RepID=UPI0018024A60|nr:lipid-transfer protein [Ramlibacter sp.]MBA2672993.1 lipid-transfer protein [Ramlibacter sp.]